MRAGVSLDEYDRLLDAGQKWCGRCRTFHPRAEFGADRSRGDGLAPACRTSKNSHGRAEYQPRPRPAPGRRYAAARDGDKLQARGRVNHLVDVGLLPSPATLRCVDCGHLGPDRRHEYDHHLGYAAEHHEDVEPVCNPCHARREVDRRGRQNQHRVDEG